MSAPRKGLRLPALPPAWRQRWQRASEAGAARWKQLSAREQRLVAALGAVLALALAWQLAVQPAWQTVSASGPELTRLRAQAAEVDALVQEAQALQGAVRGRIAPQDMPRELAASLARAGLGAEAAITPVAGSAEPAWDYAFEQVPATALFNWISLVPGQLRLSVHSAHIARSKDAAGKPVPARVSGSIRLLAAGEPQ
ncbi:type II secretion system protein GspM [Orrella sp. JC864]|uniref:type II secretion system protein GspM n=1 Tax=Orrella sp. JC864 TaxID=3120298 RepID=UPI0012BCC121